MTVRCALVPDFDYAYSPPGIHLNHVDMASQPSGQAVEEDRAGKSKRFDLATATDRLWRTHRASPFSEVAGALQEELGVLQEREKKLGALKASVQTDGQSYSAVGGQDATSALTNTIK